MSETALAALSLVFLLLVLAIGFVKKVNMGYLAMGAALILGRIGGVADKAIIASFNTSLFVSLIGPAFLFSMAVNNGSIDLLAKKIIRLAGKRAALIPIIIGVMTFALSALGCGNIPTGAILLPMSIVIALELKIDAIAMACIVTAACNFGCVSPFSNGGIIITNLANETKFAGQFYWSFFGSACLVFVIVLSAFYFIYKMYKPAAANLEIFKDLPKFDKGQKITLAACAAVVFAVFVFGVNIGLAAPLAAVILVILGVANDKAAIKIMPWGTYILVCGVSMLMSVVKTMGGVDMMVGGLTSIMTDHLVAPVMSLAAGVLSWFSSTTGVVMPTLIPTVPEILQTFPSASYSAVVSGITMTSFLAAFSPASTGGAGVMAQYAIFNQEAGEKDTNKLFIRLFLTSVVSVAVSTLLAAVGLYKIF